MLASTVQFSKNNRAHQNRTTNQVMRSRSRSPSQQTKSSVSSGPNSVSNVPAVRNSPFPLPKEAVLAEPHNLHTE
jgi:hypothetical protein